MGMNPIAYQSAWFLYFLINGFYVSLVFILPLYGFGFFSDSSIMLGSILGLYFLYMLSTFCFILFLSSFFNDSKTAAQVIE